MWATMKATYANLNFLVAPLEKVKTGEMNFDNIYYLTLYTQVIISISI